MSTTYVIKGARVLGGEAQVHASGQDRLPGGGQLLLALPGGAVHRVLVELRDHVPAEGLDRLDRDLDRHRRGQHAEGELVGADVGIGRDGAGALVRVATATTPSR